MSDCVRRCAKLGLVDASDFGQTFADPVRGSVILAKVAKEWVFSSRNVPSHVITQFLAGLEEGSKSEIFVGEKEIESKYGREMLDWLIKFEVPVRNVGKDKFYRALVVDSLAVILGILPEF